MKWFFVLLLLLNTLYFGWQLNQELDRKRYNAAALVIPTTARPLSLLSELEHPAEKRQAPAQLQVRTQLPQDIATVAIDTLKEQTGIKDQSMQPSCFSYGPMPTLDESILLADWFKRRGARVTQRSSHDTDNTLFWVYLAPQKENIILEIVADLEKKGVKDLLMISQSDLSKIISLGLFSSQAGVNRRLQEIEKKGYQPVVLPYHTEKEALWLDVALPDQDDTILTAMQSGLPSIYNSKIVACNSIVFPSMSP